jgi:hypothetical protein
VTVRIRVHVTATNAEMSALRWRCARASGREEPFSVVLRGTTETHTQCEPLVGPLKIA